VFYKKNQQHNIYSHPGKQRVAHIQQRVAHIQIRGLRQLIINLNIIFIKISHLYQIKFCGRHLITFCQKRLMYANKHKNRHLTILFLRSSFPSVPNSRGWS